MAKSQKKRRSKNRIWDKKSPNDVLKGEFITLFKLLISFYYYLFSDNFDDLWYDSDLSWD